MKRRKITLTLVCLFLVTSLFVIGQLNHNWHEQAYQEPTVIFHYFESGKTQMHFKKGMTEEKALAIMKQFIEQREEGELFDEEKENLRKL